jgi:hypothetical protein
LFAKTFGRQFGDVKMVRSKTEEGLLSEKEKIDVVSRIKAIDNAIQNLNNLMVDRRIKIILDKLIKFCYLLLEKVPTKTSKEIINETIISIEDIISIEEEE